MDFVDLECVSLNELDIPITEINQEELLNIEILDVEPESPVLQNTELEPEIYFLPYRNPKRSLPNNNPTTGVNEDELMNIEIFAVEL